VSYTYSTLRRRFYEAFNNRLRTFAGGRWADHCRPVSITALLTELCNARCIHCDIWKNRGREDSPSFERWKQVLSELRQWLGPVLVTLTGGEALLKPFATDLVAHGTSLGLLMELLSHGYWDDQSRIEKLALARPWRVTISLDGLGETHTRIRGRDRFFEKTNTTLQTLQRIRKENKLKYTIRLKTVLMDHNLDDISEIPQFARQGGMEVFFQPIEQNYNTPEDLKWFEHSENWPKNTEKAVAVVEKLIRLKEQGLPIANSFEQLKVIIPYFRNPDSCQFVTKSHAAENARFACAALSMLQLQANGGVTVCTGLSPVGNIKTVSIRKIWENRPQVWLEGCCMNRRCSLAEKQTLQPPSRS
jgi:MoaA/NifB/PqqE/SkfB family radical SAM enzyme